jgi:hypothetical protein
METFAHLTPFPKDILHLIVFYCPEGAILWYGPKITFSAKCSLKIIRKQCSEIASPNECSFLSADGKYLSLSYFVFSGLMNHYKDKDLKWMWV